MIRDLRKNKNGIVFIVVVMIIMVMMTLVVTLLSLNVSQTFMTEGEYRRTKAEILATGLLFASVANKINNSSMGNFSRNETLDGQNFAIDVDVGVGADKTMNIIIDY
jgi:hypothetical protein